MAERTIRDRIWNYALKACVNGETFRTDDLADELDISTKTARRSLTEMVELGWLTFDGGNGPVPKTFRAGPEFEANHEADAADD